MLKGVYLTLMIGPVVPVPVPQQVLDALTSLEVTVASDTASGFQLSFTLNPRSPLQTLFLLSGGSQIPLLRVIIVVTVNGTPDVLMDGVVTNHEISPGSGGQFSTLTVTGEDLSRVMSYQQFSNPRGVSFPAMPAEAQVALLLAKYAAFGIVPMIIPSPFVDVPIPLERIPGQQGTDLEHIQQLADRVGHVFYLNPGPVPASSVAYWGPPFKVGFPQPALNTNLDAYTNVESLSFRFDGNSRRQPILRLQIPQTRTTITLPVPDISPLNPPLGLVSPIALEREELSDVANLPPTQAAAIALARAAQSAEAVTGTGSLDVLHYGRVLKARQLVGVRGAGTAFDGLYYVKSVTHTLRRGEYKQNFTLTRNGLISTLPQVPV